MNDAFRVEVFNSFQDLAYNVDGFRFSEFALGGDLFKEFSSGSELECKIVFVSRFEPVV